MGGSAVSDNTHNTNAEQPTTPSESVASPVPPQVAPLAAGQPQTAMPPAAGQPQAAMPPVGGPPPGYGYAQPAPAQRINPLSVVTLVAGFFVGFVAVILGVISLRQNWVTGMRGSGLSWVGIICGAIGGVVGTLILIIFLNASR